MMACSVGNVEAARALLMFGASLDLEDVSISVYTALVGRDLTLMYNDFQVHGMTALMVAARDGRASCVRLLVRRGRINLSRNRVRRTRLIFVSSKVSPY